MSRTLRSFAPNTFWFVTDRCLQQRFLLRADPAVRAAILRALTEMLKRYEVRLLAYVIMSNHWHLVLECRRSGELSRAMQFLKSRVATDVNELRGRDGPVFQDRFHAVPILDDESLSDRIAYCLANPSAAGLAATIREYVGASSWRQNLRGEKGELPVVLMPAWEGLTETELRAARASLGEELRARERATMRERVARGLRRPKPEVVFEIEANDRPASPARRPPPKCFAATKQVRQAFCESWQLFMRVYKEASAKFRDGLLHTLFPEHCFLPRLTERPRTG